MSTRLQVILLCLIALAASHWLGLGALVSSKKTKEDKSRTSMASELQQSWFGRQLNGFFTKKLKTFGDHGTALLNAPKFEIPLPAGAEKDDFRQAVFKVFLVSRLNNREEVTPLSYDECRNRSIRIKYVPHPNQLDKAKQQNLDQQMWPDPAQPPKDPASNEAQFTVLRMEGKLQMEGELKPTPPQPNGPGPDLAVKLILK